MNLLEPINTLKQLLSGLPINIFDVILLIAGAFYVYEEASVGIIPSLTNLFAMVISFLGGLLLYHKASALLILYLSLPKGVSDALCFLAITVLLYFIIVNLISFFTKKFSIQFPDKYAKLGGAVSGLLSFSLVSAFVVSLLLSFPVSAVIKSEIRNSFSGKILFTKTQTIEVVTKQIFGGVIDETLNFMTIKADHDSVIMLNFKTQNVSIDSVSEKKMLELVNSARKSQGLSTLTSSSQLAEVARSHAKDMLSRGYFSHYTPEGFSPFDRLEKANIIYTTAAENLAYAPEVDLAFSGLMKSEGHKRNILDPTFTKIGIGVIDAGIYGKMFAQEFTD